MQQLNWYGLYGDSWQGEITPEAFSHPAKYSRALIRKIYQHMLESGWIKSGDKVIDPFGGVALGGYHALQFGLHWHGCELEPKFVQLGNENIDLWNGRYAEHFTKWGTAVLVQGDSRNLAENIQGYADMSLSSPPYATNTVHGGSGLKQHKDNNKGSFDYGASPLNLGHMPEGSHDAAVSSPVYADTVKSGEGTGVRFDPIGHKGDNAYKASSQAQYGNSNGQLGAMSGGGFEAAVSSSPFEGVLAGQEDFDKKRALDVNSSRFGRKSFNGTSKVYGNRLENIGNETGQTFWAAARQIVEQTYMVLKPGAYTAWVCGDFVRKGERVFFGRQWMELCTAVGFEPIAWAVAWKTEYKGNQLDIFGNDHEKRIDRVSFFRRLANEKNPDNAILNEDVIFMRKPL